MKINFKVARKAAFSTIFLLSSGVCAYPQEQHQASDTLVLDGLVVSAAKVGKNVADIPARIEIATSLDVKKASSFTVADVLKTKPGISKGGDGIWATNINLRGFGENRLVTLVDRNRVETATDLTVSLSMIDVNDIERVEVMTGAQSSIYGSGAMGGIINVVTKDGHFSSGAPYFSGSFNAGYSSVNNGHREYLSLLGGGGNWYVKVNGSFAGAGDARTPDGYLANSGYKSANAGLIAAFKPSVNSTLKAQFQYNHSWDVGIPGGASFSPLATASYKNADRTMASLSYEVENVSRRLERLRFKVWYQGIFRDVEMLPGVPQPQTGSVPVLVTPQAFHRTFGADAESVWKFAEWNTLTCGAEVWRRNISSERNKYVEQYSSGSLTTRMVRNEMPLPDASHTSAGLFVQDEMRFFDGRLILSMGARADINIVRNGECHNVEYVKIPDLDAVNPNPPGKYVTFKAGGRTEPSWSANAGLLFKTGRKCDLVLNVSRFYRSPALEELFKFIDLTGNRIHFGNPLLKPEKGIGGDVGVRFRGDRLDFSLSLYASGIRDMIVERKVNADPASVNDTLVLDNAGRAILYGFDFGISYEVIRGLKLFASGACTMGREIALEQNCLPMIPPLNGRAGISYENLKVLGAELSVAVAGAKKAGQTAPGERETEAWCRLDLSVHSKIFTFGRCGLQIFGGIDNITDARYTNFLSTNRGNIICEPGRNFFVRANLTF